MGWDGREMVVLWEPEAAEPRTMRPAVDTLSCPNLFMTTLTIFRYQSTLRAQGTLRKGITFKHKPNYSNYFGFR